MKKSAVQIPGNYYFDPSVVPIAIKKVQGDSISHAHDYTSIPHWHDFTELVIITKGWGLQSINGRTYPVSAGDIFVIGGETTHYFEKYASLEIINIMFDEKIFDPFREYLKRISGYHMIFCFEPELRVRKEFRNTLHLDQPDLAHIQLLVREMEQEQEKRNIGFEAGMISDLWQLSVFLSRRVNQTRAGISRLAGLLSELENSCGDPWDLQRMAQYCCMSKNTLLRTFRQVVKQSPLQYLTFLRLNQACRLLSSSELSISEIAASCGFRDSNYFTKCFQKHLAQTPGKFRRQGKKSSFPLLISCDPVQQK